MKYKHLFGPVPSRRLGISLGVDLIPYKVCNFNCVYCESGRTTNLTNDRKEYFPTETIIDELTDFLKNSPELDHITFSGAGEPTLNSGIGKIISFIQTNYPQYKTALITNSALFTNAELRKEIADVDLILPSLDAASQQVFEKINRSASSLEIDDIIHGLFEFTKEYKGKLWLEVFIVPGINDTKSELTLLKTALQYIQPERVQLNTLDRPGTESSVKAISKQKLEEIAEFFQPLPTEIIAKFKSQNKIKSFNTDIETAILDTIRRRPCTKQDMVDTLSADINKIELLLTKLIDVGKVRPEIQKRGTFYTISEEI